MNLQRTLVLIKPDGIQRGLIGQITQRFERKGLKLIGLKMIRVDDVLLDVHYAHLKDKPFFQGIKDFMKSSPMVAMVWEGQDSIDQVRTLVGATQPKEALPGTIRGDFAMSVPSNLIHASDSEEGAAEEVKRFFKEDELFEYEKTENLHIYAD
jgi:nucleoside-diphosphate kinase